MYRLPTQFDASASRQDLAAAGGGSTSTTCSSCIVTLLGTSVLSAVVLGSLEPVAPAAASRAAQATADSGDSDTGIRAQPHGSSQEPAIAMDPDLTKTTPPAVPVAGLSRTSRTMMGLFALPVAAMGGGFFMSFAGPMFGLFIAVGVFVGLYAIVHERSGRSLGRGIGIGIALLLGLFAAGALEMVVWLGVMK